MDHAWKYSAQFKLYGKDGLAISFIVNGDDGTEHMANMQDYLTTLLGEEGFSITPEGIKPGEKLQEVDGWVLGETSEGKPCVHLFKSPLQWKVATIYEERIKDIPIKIPRNQQVWPGAAPEREGAERRQMLNACNFTIVLVPTGKTSERGHPIMKFDRTVGFGGKGDSTAKGQSRDPMDSYADLGRLLGGEPKKLMEWCKQRQESEQNLASLSQIQALVEEIDNIVGDKGAGEIVLEVLTGVSAPDLCGEVKSYVTNGLTEWIAPFKAQGKKTVENDKRKPQMVEAVKAVWKMADDYIQATNGKADNRAPSVHGGNYTDEDIPF